MNGLDQVLIVSAATNIKTARRIIDQNKEGLSNRDEPIDPSIFPYHNDNIPFMLPDDQKLPKQWLQHVQANPFTSQLTPGVAARRPGKPGRANGYHQWTENILNAQEGHTSTWLENCGEVAGYSKIPGQLRILWCLFLFDKKQLCCK